jgi:GT2 family glycosyltransferase
VRASVVIPTRSRAARLDALLSSLAAQTVAPDEFEIVVVDNGSTDWTVDVVGAWQERNPHVRLVTEPVVGVSRARNAGTAAAEAPIVAFLDDDVVADPGWLEALLAAYERWPDAGIVCGRANLLLETSPPRWFGPQVAGWYSEMEFGEHPRLLARHEVPWSLNLSARSEVVRAVGGFPVHLGRVGDNLRGGEEAPFVERVRATGAAVVYEPGALVRHVVPADRLRVAWLLRRAWSGGLDTHETAGSFGLRAPESALGALGHLLFRSWRSAARRARTAATVREALLSELCHRTAALAALRRHCAVKP